MIDVEVILNKNFFEDFNEYLSDNKTCDAIKTDIKTCYKANCYIQESIGIVP